MKEIKFRAWDNKRKLMYYNIGIVGNNTLPRTVFGGDIDSLKLVDDYELMQFTGLKDRNGKEIYEGDIFKDSTYAYVVYWNDGAAGFKVKKINYSGKLIPPFYSNIEEVCKNMETAGNIYENQKLIK